MPCFIGNRRFSITLVTTYRNFFENYLPYVEIGELGQTQVPTIAYTRGLGFENTVGFCFGIVDKGI